MALEGTFKDFGLADIFQLVGLQKKTGVLTVRAEGGRLVTVSFEKGMVVFADEFQRSEAERLGSVLLRTRRLSQEQLVRAMEVQKATAQRLGHVLVDQKFVSHRELSQALQLQVKETVYRLFRWSAGSYHFSPEPVTYDHEIYVPLPAELVLMEGVRMIDEWPILEKKIPNFQVVFERVAGAAPPRPAAAGSPGAALDDLIAIIEDEPATGGEAASGGTLGPRETALLGLVDGVRSVQEVIDLGGLGEFETCKVLYGLISLNLIRARAGLAPASVAPAARPAATAGRAGGTGELALVAAVALVAVLAAFLFNPWGIVAQGFRARQGRQESAALADAVRLRRVRFALEVFFLEKQSYPASLGSLVESGLLRARELRGAGGARLSYRVNGREYRLEREATR